MKDNSWWQMKNQGSNYRTEWPMEWKNFSFAGRDNFHLVWDPSTWTRGEQKKKKVSDVGYSSQVQKDKSERKRWERKREREEPEDLWNRIGFMLDKRPRFLEQSISCEWIPDDATNRFCHSICGRDSRKSSIPLVVPPAYEQSPFCLLEKFKACLQKLRTSISFLFVLCRLCII